MWETTEQVIFTLNPLYTKCGMSFIVNSHRKINTPGHRMPPQLLTTETYRLHMVQQKSPKTKYTPCSVGTALLKGEAVLLSESCEWLIPSSFKTQ
jgi:hypothetical protein